MTPRPDPERTAIGDFAQDHPEATALLSSLQIDFFCRADRTVSQACAEVAMTADELFDILDAELGDARA